MDFAAVKPSSCPPPGLAAPLGPGPTPSAAPLTDADEDEGLGFLAFSASTEESSRSAAENGDDGLPRPSAPTLDTRLTSAYTTNAHVLVRKFSRSSLFRARLIRSPRYFEVKSNPSFLISRDFEIARFDCISNFFTCPVGLGNSGITP